MLNRFAEEGYFPLLKQLCDSLAGQKIWRTFCSYFHLKPIRIKFHNYYDSLIAEGLSSPTYLASYLILSIQVVPLTLMGLNDLFNWGVYRLWGLLVLPESLFLLT